MKNITQTLTSLTFLLFFICLNGFSQGILQVTGNGQIITNPDTTPSPSDNTDLGDVGTGTFKINAFILDNLASGGSAGNRLNNISISINNTTDFALSATSFPNLTGSGGTYNLNVTFTPSSLGTKSATITISHTNPVGTYTFNIKGNGIILPADINLKGNGNSIIDGATSTSLSNHTNFGNIDNGTPFSRIFTVENTGGQNLTNISAVTLTNNTVFTVKTNIPGTPLTLSGGASTTFEIEFTPSSANTFSDTVTLTSDDPDEGTYTFAISGNGVTPALINAGAVWKYYDAANQPSNDGEGDSWKVLNFNDTTWASGQAELGYGDTQVTLINSATEVGYFRRTINVPDHTIYNSLDMEALRDDGIIVYINGIEAWRDNMPQGAVSYSTFAPSVASDDGAVWQTKSVQNLLVTGNNIIAVEVHQESATSSDISFDFKLNGSAAIISPVTRGPYLQSGTSNSVIVKWRTSMATDTKVNYGIALGSLNSTVSDATMTTEHEIEITGLAPNTVYYYELADTGGVYLPESSEMYIKTAPSIGTDQFVRAWILGDAGTEGNGTYPGQQKAVRDAYYNYVDETGPTGIITNPNQTDMILFLGDNAYNDGTDIQYQKAVFEVYQDMLKKSVSWSCLGNHDGYTADSNSQTGPYYDIFTFPKAGEVGGTASGTEAYYSFDYANIHFVILDSYETDRSVGAPMYNWTINDLANTTQDWIVVLFHHPPYTKGSHNSDSETELVQMRQNFLPILEAGGTDLVLSGHSHSYERSYFLKGHYGLSGTFNSTTMTKGANGDLSGRDDTADGAYSKTDVDTEGAVYITAGSSGKATGATFSGDPYNATGRHLAMYYSAQSLGSTILEIEDDGSGGQNMKIKYLRETGAIDDYFTINKSGVTLSVNSETVDNVKLYPVPANHLLNIKLNSGESLQNLKLYNVIGELVLETQKERVNVSTLKPGVYLVQIQTDKNQYFKNIIVN